MGDDHEIDRLFHSISPQVENLIVLAAIALIAITVTVIAFWGGID